MRLKALIIDVNNHHKFILIGFPLRQYLLPSMRFQTTPAYTGSEIDVSESDSFSTGRPINTGSLRTFLAVSMSPLCFTAHHTKIAHSGSMPSLHIFLSSALTNENISSYLAVTI